MPVFGQPPLTKELSSTRSGTTNKPIYKPFEKAKRNIPKKSKKQQVPQLELEGIHRHTSEIMVIPDANPSDPKIEQFNLCPTCQCHLPPRAYHCKRCNRCVLRRDHHCAWLRSCIGFYNYKFFILLLYYASALLALVSTSISQRLIKGPHWAYIAFLVISAPELCILVALCFFHTALLVRNMTSLEKIKHLNHVIYLLFLTINRIHTI